MSVASDAGITTGHRTCIPEPLFCRWVALGDPHRRPAGPTFSPRVVLYHLVGSGHCDFVASTRPRPLRPSTGDDLAGAAAVPRSSSGPHRPTTCTSTPRPSSARAARFGRRSAVWADPPR